MAPEEMLPAIAESPEPNGQSSMSALSPYQMLEPLLRKHKGSSHVVLLQGTPDPDSISSALALQFLGDLHDIDTSIVAFSNVSHHENRALLKRLGISLTIYDGTYDFNKHQLYSLVDSQRSQTPVDRKLADAGVEFFMFIDHHRADVTTPCSAQFIDIREHVGSCAAILCEYLGEAFPKGLEPSDATHVRLATALMHGVRSDTSKFLLATPKDYDAAAYISPSVDHHVIELIERATYTSSVLELLENALVNRKVIDNFMFSDIGFVRSADRDSIPQAADLLLAREGTDTVLVFGIVDEKTIDGSFRTRSETINPDEFLNPNYS